MYVKKKNEKCFVIPTDALHFGDCFFNHKKRRLIKILLSNCIFLKKNKNKNKAIENS